jgi:hypothetical protein
MPLTAAWLAALGWPVPVVMYNGCLLSPAPFELPQDGVKIENSEV